MNKMTYKDAATEALTQAMEADSNVFLFGEGVDNINGIMGHVKPAFAKFGPSRVIDTPLSENGLTGFAIGAALAGMRPVLIHQRDDFMSLTLTEMSIAAMMRYSSGGKHKVPMTILSFIARRSGEGCWHSQSLQSVFAHFPGIKVGMPASPIDVKGMILAAIFDDDPVVILEHRHTPMFEMRGFVPKEVYKTPFKPKLVQPGNDITVVTTSIALLDALDALGTSDDSEDGLQINAEIIDLRWLKPLDPEIIIDSVKKTGRLLVVDTGWSFCGIASEIVAVAAERAGNYFKCLPRRITLPDTPCPASEALLKNYHPNPEMIIRTVKEMIK